MAEVIDMGGGVYHLRIKLTPDNMAEVNDYFPDFLGQPATLVGEALESDTALRDAALYWGCGLWNAVQEHYTQGYVSYGYMPGDNPKAQNALVKVDSENPRVAIFLLDHDTYDGAPYIDLACDANGELLNDLGTDNTNASTSVYTRLQFTISNDSYLHSGATNVLREGSIHQAQNRGPDWHDLVQDEDIVSTSSGPGSTDITLTLASNNPMDMLQFISNIPVFLTYEAAKAYIETGAISLETCFNAPGAFEGFTGNKYNIRSQTYEYDQYREFISKESYGHLLIIDAGKDAEIRGWVEEGPYHNVRLKAYGEGELTLRYMESGSLVTTTMSISDFNESRFANNFNTWPDWKSYGRNKWVRGNIWSTNINFAEDEDAADYSYEHPEDAEYINEGEDFESFDYNDLGDPADTSADLTDKTFDATTGFITLYESTAGALNQLGSTIFDSSNWNDLQDALKIYGESPINSIIKCFHCPIDISAFITTEAATGFKVGSYTVSTTGVNKVQKYGKIVKLCDVIITPTYNDFRDYQNFNYELHLPFSNAINLSADELVNKMLTIKAAVDPVNLQIRYYIIINSTVYKIIDASFGRQVAIIGNDFAGKAREIRQDMFNLAGSAINIATGVMQPNPFAAAQGVSQGAQSLIGTLEDFKKEPTKQIVGSFASGCGESDILYPYLVITETLSIKPALLESTYGRPTNIVNTLGSVSGFTCAELARVEVNCTDQEKNEIEQLVSQGIII